MTFRLRTALVVLVLTFVTMGGAFGGVWYAFVRAQRQQLDASLLVVARREAAAAAAGKSDFTDEPGPSPNAAGPLPKYGVLYRRTGASLFSTKNFASIPPMPRSVVVEEGFNFTHEGIAMRAVLVPVGDTGRHMLLATPRDDFEEDATMLARAMAIAVAFGSLWAAVVAFAVAGRLTRNHRLIAHVARRVASGDTSARVEFRTTAVDLEQLAVDINTMIAQLVSLLASRETFIAHAAHELRTPLTSLRIELEHTLDTGRERTEFEAALHGALDSAQRLSDLADDLLELAKLKASRDDGAAAVDAAIVAAIADVAVVARERDVVLDAAVDTGVVPGDTRSLARLFRNVLENAIRFSPRGAHVVVRGRAGDTSFVVEVTDEGPGVQAREAERIFEPFARVGDAAGVGTGLGLTIARGIARSSGGDVAVRPGRGGCFVITLPLSVSGRDHPSRSSNEDALAGSSARVPG